jgi:hypothetical protein
MSNTDPTKHTGVDSGAREREVVPAYYKTLSMLLIKTMHVEDHYTQQIQIEYI